MICACGMSSWEDTNICFRLLTICCARVSYWNLSTHSKFKGNNPSACSQYWIMMWLCFPVLNCVGKEAKNSEALPFGTKIHILDNQKRQCVIIFMLASVLSIELNFKGHDLKVETLSNLILHDVRHQHLWPELHFLAIKILTLLSQ